jgi:hypothetical protein
MRYLITHSLLSSWLWTIKENPYEDATTEDDSWDRFLLTLNREPTPVTPAMQDGIDFEQLVTDLMLGQANPKHKWYKAAHKVCELVHHGSPLQLRASREVNVAGKDILLYGRLDALRMGTIYDIKFSKRYERGRYIDSTQHPMYLELIPEARRFAYVVSNGWEVWQEVYERDDTPSIIPIIEDFLAWLETQNLMAVYEAKWQTK